MPLYKKHSWRKTSHPPAPRLGDLNVVAAVIRSGRWTYGKRARRWEGKLADALGVPPEWVLATANATSALAAALEVGRVASMAALTFPGVVELARLLGHDIDLVDADEDGWASGDTDYAVDLWGRPAPRRSALLDAAHRFLAPEHPEFVRGGGALVYSHGPQKELPTPAGGGALIWEKLARVRPRVVAFLNHGRGGPTLGVSLKGLMPELAAGYLLSSFDRLPTLYAKRQRMLSVYEEFLGGLLLTKPDVASGHLAVIRCHDAEHRARVAARLDRVGVEHSCHYQIPEEWECPNATALSQRLLTLPCQTHLTPLRAAKIARWVLTA